MVRIPLVVHVCMYMVVYGVIVEIPMVYPCNQ